VAVTEYGPPAVALAVKIPADETPDALVDIVIVLLLLLKAPDAPDPGAAKTTFAPDIGLLKASFMVTASGFAKAVLTVADCGVEPATAVIDAAAPAKFVNVKFTLVRPAADAVTV
jgi:hypothetical protein